jgi:hypothetical protein
MYSVILYLWYMTPQKKDSIAWYDSVDDVTADGYCPIKVTSNLCFFRLTGKKPL